LARADGAEFAGIGDVDGEAAAKLAEETGAQRAGAVETFLDDPAVNAVLIATPTETHSALVERAAAAGKHIFCEKPISLDLAATKSAIAAVRKSGVTLQIGFQRRYDPRFVRARQAVESGDLGTLRFLRLVGRDRVPPSIDYVRTSGGQYRDQMVHEFDAARWLSGEEVQEVTAVGSALVDARIAEAGDVDTAVACLRFESGALAVIDSAREAVYGYDSRLEILGSNGLFLDEDRLKSDTVMGVEFLTPDAESFATRFSDAYRLELQDFIESLRTSRLPRAGGDDALQALRIAIAADHSRKARRTIPLAEIDVA
jgi:myo-inositol 2-dehydrogenase/D-chiro-inositol 1-dehydrogenase